MTTTKNTTTTAPVTKMKLRVKSDAKPFTPAKSPNPSKSEEIDKSKFNMAVRSVVNDMLDKGEISFETPAEGIVNDVREALDDLIPAIFEKLLAYGKTHGSNAIPSTRHDAFSK